MHPLVVSYTKAINKQRNRVGPVFQGAYKTKFVETDENLLELSRYLHLNPVKSKLVINPEDWQYSSYKSYIGLTDNEFIDQEFILNIIGSPNSYRKFVEEGFKYPKN